MGTKYVQPGKIMTRSNPGGSAADAVVKIGRRYGVTLNGSATEATGTLQQVGVKEVYKLPKLADGEGITQGATLYWNGSSITTTVTGGFPIGSAFETMTTGASEGAVDLNDGFCVTGSVTGAYA